MLFAVKKDKKQTPTNTKYRTWGRLDASRHAQPFCRCGTLKKIREKHC